MVPVTASAIDGSGVAKVEFYVDNAKVGESVYAPYTYDWQATVGSHTLTARAYDALGNVGESSVINLKAIPAKVTVTSLSDGSSVGGIVKTFTATYRDPFMEGKVCLYIDGVYKRGVILPAGNTEASISYDWDTTQYANGSTHLIEIEGQTLTGSVWSLGKSTVTVDNP